MGFAIDLLHFAYFQEPFQKLCVTQFRVPEDGTSTLNRFDDLVRHVASKAKSRRI